MAGVVALDAGVFIALTHAQALATTDESLARQAETRGLHVFRPVTNALGVSA